MFPHEHRINELLLDEPSIILEQDLLSGDRSLLESLEIMNIKKRKRTSKSGVKVEKVDEGKKESELRKTMHREIERQRRQDMSTLYASLRDLLPLEYIKGKRSVSDHMHEATNYIKHMEKKIEEMQLRKDNLKNNVANLSNSQSQNGGSSNNFDLPNFVTLNCCCDGVEVLINCGNKDGCGHTLSKVIAELIQTGLDVVSCISNKVNQRFFYKIHTEVNPLQYINLPELQQRLVDAMK